MALERVARVAVDGFPGRLHAQRIRGTDRLHAPFAVEVSARAVDGAGTLVSADLDALLGRTAEVALALGDGDERRVHGVVEDVEQRYGELLLTVVPRIAPLADAIDHQVFLQKDAVAIARDVLTEHGIDVAVRVTRTLPERGQCVQAFESDLAFVSRILAEEGIAWFVEHESGKDVVVFADSASAYAPIVGNAVLPFAPEAGLVGQECVFDVRLKRAVVRDAVRLRDYDFEHPLVDQHVEATAGPGALPLVEVPGGYRDPALGKVVAGLRLEQERARQLMLQGRTSCRRFAVGHTFALEGAPREGLNRRWLLLEVRWEVRDGAAQEANEPRYQAEFVAVPAETPYRPARAKAPTLGGVQTATVTGSAGTEIHTNAHGQVTSLLRWDRRRAKHEKSSAWVRPLQPQTSGAMFLPRVGWEVLLGFSGQSADTPYVLGRLDNGAAPPAEGLPAKQVRSAFGSRTTPGGGSANVLRTDDAAGHEDMLLNASSDYNERTESDKAVSVSASDGHSIGANRTQIVGLNCEVKVDGAQSTAVGASRSVDVGGGMAFALGSESVSVGAARLFVVGGDYSTDVTGALARVVGAAKIETAIASHNRHVNGVATVLVGGNWNEVGGVTSSVGVAGAHARAIGGPMNIRTTSYTLKATALLEAFGAHTVSASGFVQDKFKSAGSLSVDASASMKGSKVIVKAKSSLTISAGGMTIHLTPSSIDVKGSFQSGVATKVTGTDKTE
jgi:type VI secretion system secreted protein VgrG